MRYIFETIMKTNLALLQTLRRGLPRAVELAALLACSGFAGHALAQNSPVGPGLVWDCVLGGPRQGLAYLVFTTNATPDSSNSFAFSAYEVLVPNQSQQGQTVEGRNDGGTETRTGFTFSPANIPGAQIFGSELTGGNWGFDDNGKLVGNFVEKVPAQQCTTNVSIISTTITNNGQVITITTTNITVNCLIPGVTNLLSFTGKVVQNTRLNLVCSTPFGNHVTYRGVPAKLLPDLGGSWQGVKKQKQLTSQEFFTMTPTADPILQAMFLPYTNIIYDVKGSAAPGFHYSGVALVSGQKKMAFALTTDVTNDIVRATVGPLNFNKVKANTRGWEQPPGTLTSNVTFNVFRN
jgi:hypothetical protein